MGRLIAGTEMRNLSVFAKATVIPAFVVTGLALTSCVAVPVATPPARVNIGATMPVVVAPKDNSPIDPISPIGLEVRAGVAPLQVFPAIQDRLYDVDLGYLLRYPDSFGDQQARHGLYAQVGLYPWVSPLWEGRLRFGVLASTDMLFPTTSSHSDIAGGASVSLSLDWAHFLNDLEPVAESSGDGAFFGWVWGEVGLGLVAGGSWQMSSQGQIWSLSLGLQTRIPAAAGIALVPLI